jgi:hypothetical protein
MSHPDDAFHPPSGDDPISDRDLTSAGASQGLELVRRERRTEERRIVTPVMPAHQ